MSTSAHSALLPDTPARFLWHYVGQRPWHFSGLLLLIVGAAGCAVSVQYGMKMLVDAMATEQRSQANVWLPLACSSA